VSVLDIDLTSVPVLTVERECSIVPGVVIKPVGVQCRREWSSGEDCRSRSNATRHHHHQLDNKWGGRIVEPLFKLLRRRRVVQLEEAVDQIVQAVDELL
jgi:hypothetical protein